MRSNALAPWLAPLLVILPQEPVEVHVTAKGAPWKSRSCCRLPEA